MGDNDVIAAMSALIRDAGGEGGFTQGRLVDVRDTRDYRSRDGARERARGGREVQERAGDWHCPRCSLLVFASKDWCFSCGEPKPSRRRSRSRPQPRRNTVRLHVENLPRDFDSNELEEVGAEYGKVLSHRMWQEGKTNAGFIEYASSSEANKALEDLEGRRIDGWEFKLHA